jgi:hypothetical protein
MAMPRITSDDPAVAQLLGGLVAALAAEGAVFHPAVGLVCANGGLSMQSDLPPESRELLVQIPEHCVPSVRDFHFSVAGDALVATPSDGAPPLQARLMAQLVALYNATGKLREHAATSPWFAFPDHPALLNRLTAGRSDETRIAPLLRSGERDAALLASFFASRCLQAWNDREDLVMPIVDFANHHRGAPPLWFGSGPRPDTTAVGVQNWRPAGATGREVYCCYSDLDAFDLFLRCGFTDETADRVQSVPVALPMPGGGGILIQAWPYGINALPADKLPAGAADLAGLYPNMVVTANRGAALGFLLIPPAADGTAMRRVLAYAIGGYCTHYRVNVDLRRLTAEAEQRVIATNLAYFGDLRRELAATGDTASPAAQALDRLITLQTGRIEAYRDRSAALGWGFLPGG